MTAPMLAHPATTKQITARFYEEPTWILQPKIDGTRLLVDLGTGQGFNRNGERIIIPANVAAALGKVPIPGMAIDGELLGNRYVAFDLITGALVDQTTRLAMLAKVVATIDHPCVVLCPTARTLDEKRELIAQVDAGNGEGWVAKKALAMYDEGERVRDWLKIKRTRSIDCVVEWLGEGKDNMGLTLYRDGVLLDGGYDSAGLRRGGIAECTRQAGDGRHVKPGDVVEVEFLYVSDDNRLVQPTKPILRWDKPATDCTWDQLVGNYTNKNLVLDLAKSA